MTARSKNNLGEKFYDLVNKYANNPLATIKKLDALIKPDIDVNTLCPNGLTLLNNAVSFQIYKTTRQLLDLGADPNLYPEDAYSPLYSAASDGDKKIVKLLLSRNADPNAKNLNTRITAIMAAGGQGYTEIALMLLDAGADINAKSTDGNTALLSAIAALRDETAIALIKRGADVNAPYENGNSALIEATEDNLPKVVRALLDHDADFNFKDNIKLTALDAAIMYNHDEIRTMLEQEPAIRKIRHRQKLEHEAVLNSTVVQIPFKPLSRIKIKIPGGGA